MEFDRSSNGHIVDNHIVDNQIVDNHIVDLIQKVEIHKIE